MSELNEQDQAIPTITFTPGPGSRIPVECLKMSKSESNRIDMMLIEDLARQIADAFHAEAAASGDKK